MVQHAFFVFHCKFNFLPAWKGDESFSGLHVSRFSHYIIAHWIEKHTFAPIQFSTTMAVVYLAVFTAIVLELRYL